MLDSFFFLTVFLSGELIFTHSLITRRSYSPPGLRPSNIDKMVLALINVRC